MKNIGRVALSLSVLLSLAAFACGGEAEDIQSGEAEEELRTSGLTSIEVGRSAGFRPPPPAGSCHASGRWTVDFVDSEITGNACIGGVPTAVGRTLSQAELARVRAKVSALRATRRPASCPTDMPVNSIKVIKGSSSTYYVDQRAACGGSNAVKEAGLAKLIDVLVDLSSTAAPPDPCLAALCAANTVCVAQNGNATCVPRMPSPPAAPCSCEVGFNCNAATGACDPV